MTSTHQLMKLVTIDWDWASGKWLPYITYTYTVIHRCIYKIYTHTL